MLKTWVLFLFAACICTTIRGEKFIINTDAGADDAVAVLALLNFEESLGKLHKFEVIGITCSYGNVDERQAEINILNTLKVIGRRNIPVYAGAKQGFIEPFKTDYFFGLDGFGNVNFTDDTPTQIDRSKHAAVALIDLVNKYYPDHNVSIISLGPTTNIALAISLDDQFIDRVHKIYQMGGSVKGIGNKDPNVEFNFAADPESNFLLYNASKKSQIIMYPWENTLDTVVKLDWRKNVLGKHKSPSVQFLNKVEKINIDRSGEDWISADALAVGAIIEPKIVLEQHELNVYPVVHGEARGSVLVDYANNTNRIRNSIVIFKINVTMYQELLIRYLGCDENDIDCNS